MINPKKLGGLIFTLAYILLLAVVATFYFGRHNFDVLWLFATFTVPASLISNQLSKFLIGMFGIGDDGRVFIEFIGFLIFGTLQFWIIGYSVGAFWKMIIELVRRRKTSGDAGS